MNTKNLKNVAKEVSIAADPQAKIEALTKAFDLFTVEAKNLEGAYADLKEQFKNVNLELEATNGKLNSKIVELDAITYYLNSILTNISQGILFIDLAGSVTTYNTAAEEILEARSGKVLFKDFWINFDDFIFGFSLRKALKAKKAPSVSYAKLKISPGRQKELEITTSFVLRTEADSKEIADAMQGIIILIRDITEIRRLQILANRNDRMKELGEMASQVAHEVRNPLGGIKGFASLLQRDLKDLPELQKLAKYIVEGADTLNSLVGQVLSYARPLEPKIEWIDLVSLAQDVQRHFQADSSISDKIKIKLKSNREKLPAPVDPQLIKRVLFNLIANAIQAMPTGGEVLISIGETDIEAVITVSDTGEGIPNENLEKIFSPFFTTTSGNGLGLAEVLKIVTAHGGTIDVISEVGKGSHFIIILPFKAII